MQKSVNQNIKPIAMPGTHEKFHKFFIRQSIRKKSKILDLGAGHGAYTKVLFDMGFDVFTCDLFPEHFHFKNVKCEPVNVSEPFPYQDNTFDIVVAIEITEHISDHRNFFTEINRILKPGGQLMVSTPNILSLKSRIRFLLQGFPYSFKPLEMGRKDGLQHIAALSLDQYNYHAFQHYFKHEEVFIDKQQKSSMWLYTFLFPILRIVNLFRQNPNINNQKKLLLGRLLFLKFVSRKLA